MGRIIRRRINSKIKTGMPLLTICIIFSWVIIAFAEDSKEQIRKRMEGRYVELLKFKKEGKIGELPSGYLEVLAIAVNDERIKTIVAEENSDRKSIYQIIAKESQTTAEEVGKTNALRIYNKADELEYFKGKDGVWRQKKEIEKKQNLPSPSKGETSN